MTLVKMTLVGWGLVCPGMVWNATILASLLKKMIKICCFQLWSGKLQVRKENLCAADRWCEHPSSLRVAMAGTASGAPYLMHFKFLQLEVFSFPLLMFSKLAKMKKKIMHKNLLHCCLKWRFVLLVEFRRRWMEIWGGKWTHWDGKCGQEITISNCTALELFKLAIHVAHGLWVWGKIYQFKALILSMSPHLTLPHGRIGVWCYTYLGTSATYSEHQDEHC